jgi:hypothetical protein
MCTTALDGTDATVMGAGMPNRSRISVVISSGNADCGRREAPTGKLSCSCNHEYCLQVEPLPFFKLQGLFTVAQRSIRRLRPTSQPWYAMIQSISGESGLVRGQI